MTVYYNDIDRHACAWLTELCAQGQLPRGIIDHRSITEVCANDVEGYAQCHFFAGIGGWPYALMLAGWPADRPVWTASLPCQPFSGFGDRRGACDDRHLWPTFRGLVADRHPPVLLGEQVASPDGREWLSAVRADLEALGYAVGAADLCAASVGAPHIRQRLYWCAYSTRVGRQGEWAPSPQHAAAEKWDIDVARLLQDEVRTAVPAGTRGALADGVSGRVGRLRGYGGAIVPELAARFIAAADAAAADMSEPPLVSLGQGEYRRDIYPADLKT